MKALEDFDLEVIKESRWGISKYTMVEINSLVKSFKQYKSTYKNLSEEDNKWIYLLVETELLMTQSQQNDYESYEHKNLRHIYQTILGNIDLDKKK